MKKLMMVGMMVLMVAGGSYCQQKWENKDWLGNDALNREKYAIAEAWFLKAIIAANEEFEPKSPQWAMSSYGLAIAYFGQGKKVEALEALKPAMLVLFDYSRQTDNGPLLKGFQDLYIELTGKRWWPDEYWKDREKEEEKE